MCTNVDHPFKELNGMNLEECLLKKLIKPEFKPPVSFVLIFFFYNSNIKLIN